MLDFLNISFMDILDIILVGLLIYQIFKLIRGTAAMGIFLGIFKYPKFSNALVVRDLKKGGSHPPLPTNEKSCKARLFLLVVSGGRFER